MLSFYWAVDFASVSTNQSVSTLLRAVWRGNKSPSIALRALVFSTRHRTLRYPPNKQSWPPSPVPPLPSLPALRSPGASSRVPPGACSATQDDVLARFFSKASGRSVPIGLSNRCPVRSERRELTSDPTFPAFSTAGSFPPSPRSSPASLSASTLRCVPPPPVSATHHRRAQISANDKTHGSRARPETRAYRVLRPSRRSSHTTCHCEDVYTSHR